MVGYAFGRSAGFILLAVHAAAEHGEGSIVVWCWCMMFSIKYSRLLSSLRVEDSSCLIWLPILLSGSLFYFVLPTWWVVSAIRFTLTEFATILCIVLINLGPETISLLHSELLRSWLNSFLAANYTVPSAARGGRCTKMWLRGLKKDMERVFITNSRLPLLYFSHGLLPAMRCNWLRNV